MCISCGSGIPVCAVNGACTIGLQQAVGTGLIFGSAFLAVTKDFLTQKMQIFVNYIRKNSQNNWK